MAPGEFQDLDAARVGAATAAALVAELGERLVSVVAHGSAVTGYIPGFSDFDFVVFLRGTIDLPMRLRLARRMHAIDRGPFAYLQMSRIVNVDDADERMQGLIEEAFVVVRGAVPSGWRLYSEQELAIRGRQAIARLPDVIDRLSLDWMDANEEQRTRIIRYLATDLKPSLRGLLSEIGEPTMEVWRSPYQELVRRWSTYNPAAAERLRQLIGRLPARQDEEDTVARAMFELLRIIEETARG